MSDSYTGQSRDKLDFQFREGNHFRVIHVDGAVGGVMPTGSIHMSVYNERHALAERLTSEASETTSEIAHRGEPGANFIREIEADLVLSLETAVALRNWLEDNIRRLEGLRRQMRPPG